MDFKRIARIFIIAFGLLNLYLINGIVVREDLQNVSTQPSDSSIIANMASSDIALPDDLSEVSAEDEEIYSLQINNDDLLEEAIEASENRNGTINEDGMYYTSFPSNPIELDGNPEDGYTDQDFNRIINFVQDENVLFGEEYTFNRYDAENNRFVFYQEVDGLPIADGTSEVILFADSEGNIISFQQTYAGNASRQGESLTLISGTRAIEILFLNNEIRQGSTIEMPMLVYRRALYLEDLSMYSPVWHVVVNYASERNTFRVDAVNGTIIRQATPTPSETDSESSEDENDEETENEADPES